MKNNTFANNRRVCLNEDFNFCTPGIESETTGCWSLVLGLDWPLWEDDAVRVAGMGVKV